MRAFHILIIEDNKSVAAALECLLRKISFNNIDQVANGYEALKLLISRQYDLIFLDNRMPVMTGIEFLRRCKCGDILDWTTVMMVTAAADTETINAIRNEGLKVDEFVIKPLDFKVVSAKVDRLFRTGNANVAQRTLNSSAIRDNAMKGSFLSIETVSDGAIATIRMFGFFLNDDRKLVKDLPDIISGMAESTILLDFSNVLMIDEFGLGMLLLMNGVATMAGKRFEMLLDEKTAGKRLNSIGLSRIIPVHKGAANLSS